MIVGFVYAAILLCVILYYQGRMKSHKEQVVAFRETNTKLYTKLYTSLNQLQVQAQQIQDNYEVFKQKPAIDGPGIAQLAKLIAAAIGPRPEYKN